MDKSTHEGHLSQPLQTNNKQFKKAVIFSSGFIDIFNITNRNNKIYFKKTNTGEEDLIGITILVGAYEIESLDNEIKMIINDKGHYSENEYPFTIKSTFISIGSVFEISLQGALISFASVDIIRNLLGFNETIFYKEYIPSPNPVDIISFDDVFIGCDIARGRLFKGKRTGIFHNCTMDVDPGYKYIEKVSGGITWYMMESKDVTSSIRFKLKK